MATTPKPAPTTALELDDTDARLLHALQIEPRASWHDLAPIIGVDAATLGRRWARLRREGIAWSTGYPTDGQLAIIELECDLNRANAVAAALEGDRPVSILDCTSGARDLLLIVRSTDLASLWDYVVNRLGALTGVRNVRTNLVSDLLSDGSHWRLRALTPAEVERIPPPRPPRPRAAHHVPADLVAAIQRELRKDGRASVTTIARQSGFPAQRVSDAIAVLRAHGDLRFRTDTARAATGFPIYAWYFIEAPAKAIEAARTRIVAVPEVRFAAMTASRHNLILAVWLRRLSDVHRFEVALGNALEGSRIADRAVVMRIAKHMGQIVGPDTRALGSANEVMPGSTRTADTVPATTPFDDSEAAEDIWSPEDTPPSGGAHRTG